MSKLPQLKFKLSLLYKGLLNDKGQLCNIYTPLLNLADETTKKLGDFTTEQLNFDLEHPVDILFLDSYDGAVNMIINDGKNKPRLINSRFSVQDENTFKIPDHTGFKDTNIYDETTFNVDTLLKAIPIHIPIIRYDGLINNGGKLKAGSYTFYFKLSDADNNETEVVAESGIVQCHIGTPNSPSSIRMGMLDEDSGKAIKFTLSNIDAGFDYIHVLFARTSSGNDLAATTTYNKIIFDYPIDKNGNCDITITGNETIIGTSREECMVDYADINSVKTLAINNNVLLFGNVDTPEHDWDAIKRFTWKIIPRWQQAETGAIGSLNTDYVETSVTKDLIEDHGYCYYNTKNVYYRVGYWPDEIYRFGIVYIFEDNSLSPVINLLGIDFNTVTNIDMGSPEHKGETTTYASEYEKIFFTEDLLNKNRCPEYLYETEDMYFNKKYKTNSRGVIKFPSLYNNGIIDVVNTKGGVMSPRPLYLNFDLSLIGYKYAEAPYGENNNIDNNDEDIIPWDQILKKHKIKGFFFVRLKRIPTIIGLGVIIGHSDRYRGSLPVIKNNNNKFVVLPFLSSERLLEEEALELEVSGTLFDYLAMLCPDAELNEATYNLLFVSNEYALSNVGKYSFDYQNRTANIFDYNSYYNNKIYNTKLTNIQEDVKSLTNGVDYFSTIAGSEHEAYKTVDIINRWNRSFPQDLTVSTSLLRGKWGPYVGLSNPNLNNPNNDKSPFLYGDIYTIKTSGYSDPVTATELDFLKVMNSNDDFFAISHRMEADYNVDCFRGDCFVSMFTHRMFRNFIDPELPTNNKIVDPACWRKNYGVRCTATFAESAHSNLTEDNLGWYIDPNGKNINYNTTVQALIYILTGNVAGFIAALCTLNKPSPKIKDADGEKIGAKEFYEKYGFANEIVNAFEVYVGGQRFNPLFPLTSLINNYLHGRKFFVNGWDEPEKKKVNPKEQESSGPNLKNIFKSDDDWELRGLASINRADVNAVAMGQWITFPICSNKNIAMRDIDFSNATEESSFNRKRSFYPLQTKDIKNHLRDSNVINEATGYSVSRRPYMLLPKVPYFKLEFFTRINNSLRSSSNSIANQFKVMLETAYKDYTKIYGSITKLESKGNYVYVIFKHGIGVMDMVSSLSKAQNANEFLPEMSIISDTYGSIWKDSIIQTPYMIYGVDSVAKAIWAILGTEVKIISDMKVEKFLIDSLDMSEFNFRPYIGHINVKTHYNAFKHDVLFTYYNDLLYKFPEGYNSLKNTIDLDGFVLDNEGNRINVGTDTSANFIKAEKLLPYYDEQTHLWKTYSDLIKDAGENNYQWVKGTNWSLCWSEDLLAFLTFYDWIPLESANIDNIYFSFDKDSEDELLLNVKPYILYPKFVERTNKKDIDLNLNLGVNLKKNLIDSAFTNTTTYYHIKSNYSNYVKHGGNLITVIDTLSNPAATIAPGELIAISMYLKMPNWSIDNQETLAFSIKLGSIKGTISNTYLHIIHSKTNDWFFVSAYVKNSSTNYDWHLTLLEIDNKGVDFYIAEPKVIKYAEPINYSSVTNLKEHFSDEDTVYKENNLFKEKYDLRDSDNSLKLWKHGLAGVFDNQGEILPTNWYGKLHEFNFEFIVNQQSLILKIFNNLKIISNKTEPYKFEYEVVGEAYEWFEYKQVVLWINDKVKIGKFASLNIGYFTVLNNTYLSLRKDYSDFPYIHSLESNPTNKILKLPYLEIKLTDKKGLPDIDKSYTKTDKWSGLTPSPSNNYNFNSVETILVKDPQLNEVKLHTEQYGNDMKKYGRVRGNMEYLEDLWDIEIRPIYFRWCFLSDEELLFTKEEEARLRDKYIKIKIRYTGKDLAVIQAILTKFNYSFA